MAAVYPTEGLDVLLAAFPKGTVPATLYVGLFTSSNGSTSVPDVTALLASLSGGFAEVDDSEWTTYERQAVAEGSWSAPFDAVLWTVTGRQVNSPQLTFPATSGTYLPADPVVGYFVADALTAGHAIVYSNFADTVPIPGLTPGDDVKLTAGMGFGQ